MLVNRRTFKVKPGKMDGRNEPTLINGAKWFPVWSSVGDHGPDRSEVFAMRIPTSADYTIASAIVNDVDVRSAISLRREEGEFLLSIPDPTPGARRYTIVLSPR